MSWFLIWMFMSVEKIAAALAIGSTIVILSLIAFFGTYLTGAILMNKDTIGGFIEKTKKYRRMAVFACIIGVIMSTTSVLMPNKKELAIIIAVGGTWEVINSEPAKEIGGKALELVKQELENALQESKGVLKDNVKAAVANGVKEYADPLK